MKKLFMALLLFILFGSSYGQLNQNLVTPNPTVEAKALYKFMLDNYGKKIISGAMTLNSMDEINWLKQNTGKEPGLIGIDYMHANRGYAWYNNATPTNDAITYYNRNGIPALMWHWRDPSRRTEEFNASGTTFDANKIFDPASSEYRAMISDIDFIAGQLKQLQNQKVAVLWRPLHEAGGGWFWWGSKGGAACKKIWQVMFDRMVNYHGLRNLIWVWTREPNDDAFYPGDAYVDLGGRDYYKTGDHGSQIAEFNSVNSKNAGKKMVTISECGSFPDPDNLVRDRANWSYFMVWYGDFIRNATYNSVSLWQKAMSHSYVLTLDEMPNLRTYTGGTGGSGCGTDANGYPICCNAGSDPDGDGWGWENNATCFVPSTNTPLGNGVYRITVRHSGKALEVNEASTADGAVIQQWAYGGGTHQRFTLTNLGSGVYSIRPVHSGKSLDVSGASVADGAMVDQWSYSGNTNQRWRIESVGSGYYRIVSVNSGKCLDIIGASTTDGADVNQYTCSGATNQQFQFSYLSAARQAIEEAAELVTAAVVAPNPSAHTFTVQLPGPFVYTIRTAAGKTLDTGKGINHVTVGHALLPGLYLLQVQNDQGTQVLKLVKE